MKINQKIVAGASAIGVMSRRSFLAASAAASIPSVALAEAATKVDRPPQSLDSQLDDCIAQLKSVLLQMYPAVGDALVRHQRVGDGFMIWITGNPAQCVEWDGVGVYEVRASIHCPAGVYKVRRVWSDMDKRHYLYGSYRFDGNFIAPAESIEPWQLVRKLEGGAL